VVGLGLGIGNVREDGGLGIREEGWVGRQALGVIMVVVLHFVFDILNLLGSGSFYLFCVLNHILGGQKEAI
jgi:hypothetical protein